MIRSVVFDVGETLTRDDRHWGDWADWLGVPRHTLSALVGAVVAQGLDNAEALRRLRPASPSAERAARCASDASCAGSGRGWFKWGADLDQSTPPHCRWLPYM